MTIQQETQLAASGSQLLTPQEQARCKQVAARRQAPHSQRALALLALNDNCTQVQASERADLTKWQVKYCVGRLRKLRLRIFPAVLLAEPAAELEDEPQSLAQKADTAGDASKTAKTKKRKKAEKKTKQTEKKPKKKTKDKKDKKKKKKKNAKKTGKDKLNKK